MRHLALFCLLLQLIFELSSSLDLRLVPGSSLKLPCLPGQTDPTDGVITWTHNAGQNKSAEVRLGWFLNIPSVTAADEGQYECVGQDSDSKWTMTYTIKVETSSVYKLEVKERQSASLLCYRPTSNDDKVYAVWLKKTENDKSRALSHVDGSMYDRRLEWAYGDPADSDQGISLKNLVLEDNGTYYCESAKGQRFSTVHLTVEAVPVAAHPCEGFTTAWEPCQDETSRSWAPMLEESLGEFSMKLYSHLSQSRPSENLLVSPISISSMLSHLLLGARDNTRRDIEVAVCVPHDFHCVHFQMRRLKENLADSLQIASQIYYNPHMNLSETFTNQSVQFYEDEPARLLDSSEENTQMINSWVANKTNNQITHLVDSVPADAQLLLLNAVSFSGQWKAKFDEKEEKALFKKLNGDLEKVPVLYSSKYLAAMEYVSDLKAQVVRFPLSGESSLYILLPRTHKPEDLRQVEQMMTDTAVRQMVQHMKTASPQVIEVTIPKIQMDIKTDMNMLLRKIGLSSLFETPNLCGIDSENKVFLNDAQHKAFFMLTDEGVEAGAATSFSFSRSFPSFSALRPFVLLLWSDQANVPLFMGRVTDP